MEIEMCLVRIPRCDNNNNNDDNISRIYQIPVCTTVLKIQLGEKFTAHCTLKIFYPSTIY